MRCRSVQKELSAYLDGEVSARHCRIIEEHLAHCDACSREYEELALMTQAFAAFRHDAPEDMWTDIEERITSEGPSRRWGAIAAWATPAWRPLAVAALLALGLLGYLWLSQPAEEVPLNDYLYAYSEFAVEASLTPDSMMAYVLPAEQSTEESSWEDEFSLFLEQHLQ